MSLRDFLLGAQQLQEGTKQYADSTAAAGLANARSDYEQAAPSLIQQFRAEADPNNQAKIAGQYQSLVSRAQMGKEDPYAEVMAKMFGPKKSGVAAPFNKDQILTVAPWVGEDQAVEIAKMEDPKIQQKTIDSLGVQNRHQANLGDRKTARNVNYGKDFNKVLQDQEVKIDDSVKGLTQSLAQFKQNPNKSSLQQLAVSMARAGGDNGVLSNQDMGSYKLNTISQDLEGLSAYITDSPENAITPSVKQALVNMAEFGLKNAQKRKQDRLESLAQNQFSVYAKDLMKDGKKSDVLKSWEKKLNVEFGQDDKGNYTVSKKKGTISGKAAELMTAASQLKDPVEKKKWMNYFSKKQDFTDAQAEYLMKQMGGK